VETLKDALRACSIAALCLGAVATQCAIAATPVTIAVNTERQPASVAQSLVFETSVSPRRCDNRPASESTKRDGARRLAADSNICKAVGLVRDET
jgi:hypothetical protein